jgi:HEXXH motif-containing protein
MSARDLEGLCRGFSCPQHGLEEESWATIAIEYARSVVERFLKHHGPTLRTAGRGLDDVIAAWLRDDIHPQSAWAPIYGLLGTFLSRSPHLTPCEAAVRLGLWLHVQGVRGEWEFRLDAPTRLRWDRWLLPALDHIRVRSDGARARLRGKTQGTGLDFRFSSNRGDWSPDDTDLPGTLSAPQVRLGRHRLTFLLDDALEAPEFSFLRHEVLDKSKWAAAPQRLDEAATLLRSISPDYLDWADRVLRYVIPLNGGPKTVNSGSSESQPSVIHGSFGCPVGARAEILIHEATHQYFHLITRLGPVEDGSDTTEYYSPIKRRGRTIRYILVAYHAFGNVLLFYRACRRRGYLDEDGYCTDNERELAPQVEQLEAGLRRTTGLTPLGRALWEPLAERIH